MIRRADALLPTGLQLIADLSSELIGSDRKNSWPGTIWSNVADINTYRFSEPALDILLSRTTGLFDWTEPDLPSDFFIANLINEPVLTTIAHHRDAFLSNISMSDPLVLKLTNAGVIL